MDETELCEKASRTSETALLECACESWHFRILLYWLPGAAKSPTKASRPLLSPKIMQADTVFLDCTCPRALAAARKRALQQLQQWGRFRLVESLRQADLVFLFSGNKYLGDYLTRDGPDKRPVEIESTIMTVDRRAYGRSPVDRLKAMGKLACRRGHQRPDW